MLWHETGYRSPGGRRRVSVETGRRVARSPTRGMAGVEITHGSRADRGMTSPRHESSRPDPQPRIRVLINPHSGAKAGIPTNTAAEEEVRTAVELHFPGLGEDMVITESEEEAISATRDAVAKGYDVVVAAGGDGTVGTVACELLGKETALGILPLGSVMNVARMLDIPRDLEGAAAVIATGEVRTIDVGEAKGQIFFEGGSVGLNAAVFREAQQVDSDSGRHRALGRPSGCSSATVRHAWCSTSTTGCSPPARWRSRWRTARTLGWGLPSRRTRQSTIASSTSIFSRFANRADPALSLLPSVAVATRPRPPPTARGCASRVCIHFLAARMGMIWGPHRWSTWCAQGHCVSSRRRAITVIE